MVRSKCSRRKGKDEPSDYASSGDLRARTVLASGDRVGNHFFADFAAVLEKGAGGW